MSDFKIEVTVRGPESTRETQYGPRSERETYARLEVPVTGEVAWRIYQAAIAESVAPLLTVEFPEVHSR